MTKFVIVIANETTLNAVQVIGPFATQGKALDSVNELAAKQKPKLAKGEKWQTELRIVDGNFIVDCSIETADESLYSARLSILPLVK